MEKELREVYTSTVAKLAKEDPRVVVLEADLSSAIGTNKIKDELGERYINVGIMEAQEISLAAGLSIVGLIPFVHSFGPFITRRAYDQVFLSLGYSRRHAVLLGSEPGVAAEVNGGTHMPFEDLALMRAVPHAYVYEPSTGEELEAILKFAHQTPALHYIRSIRKAPPVTGAKFTSVEDGYATVKEGTDGTIFACGLQVKEALDAAIALEEQGISLSVIDMFRIKPLNEQVILEAAQKGPIITAENHNVIGGLGSAIAEFVAENCPTPMYRVGVRESFGQVGRADYLIETYNLGKDEITKRAQILFSKE